MKHILYYLNILLNISHHEWPRIMLSWLLRFVVHVAFIMSSTILLALFVEQYHIAKLPLLYIISALFVVGGSIVFSFVFNRNEKKHEIRYITILVSLTLASIAYFGNINLFFFGVLFFSISVFIAQLNIIISLFIEDLFSPLESERTFPIIESAEPLGGIAAGSILYIGVTFFELSAVQLLYVVSFLLILITPILLIFTKAANKVPKLESHEERKARTHNRVEKSKKGLRHIKGLPFLKGMALVVFLHFAFVNFIEFQYTTVIDAHLQQQEGAVATSHAEGLTHGLAFWHVMFSLVAFVAQIFSVSRIHKHFGVMKSMKIHPILNVFATFILLFKFGYLTGIFSRGVFELSTIMHRTTYSASFYVIKKSIREHVKEFMEGIVRPFGAIAGTFVLYFIIYFVPTDFQHMVINIVMMGIMALMYFVLHRMQWQYTLVAKKNLNSKNPNVEKMNAVEVLSQKGHKNVAEILGKNLHEKQHMHIQCKLLDTIGTIQDVNSIPDILRMFQSKNAQVQQRAVFALMSYENLGGHFFTQSFAKHRVIESLKTLFLHSKSKKIKSVVVQAFKNINNADIIPFLLEALKSKDEEIIADAIFVCGLFHDINSAYYVEEFLYSKNPKVQSSAIIALWNFAPFRLKTLIQLTKMLESKDEEVHVSGIYSLGEIKAVQEIPKLKRLLEYDNEYVQCHAAIALAKMHKDYALDYIVYFLLHKNKQFVLLTKKLLKNIPVAMQKNVQNSLIHEVSHKIQKVLSSEKTSILEEISEKSLQQLHNYYILISETKSVLRIEEEIIRRGESV
jgi:HEAT repeat protein